MADASTFSAAAMPVVGVPTCRHNIGDLEHDCTQYKYLAALYHSAGVLPLLIPLFGNRFAPDTVLDRFDGILLTGSHSNIHPRHYDSSAGEPGFKLDEHRDSTVLPLIRKTVDRGIPLLALCRGFQELNVACGGSLYPELHLEEGFIEHREDSSLPLDERYAPAHAVHLEAGGRLRAMTGVERIEVNSLHQQGIREAGQGLVIEGRSEDGLVEAARVGDSRAFAIGVQWHPEWKSTEDPVSAVLFDEFGRACRRYARGRA